MALRIDAHHHFWRYSPADHGWLTAERFRPLQRDFLAQDLVGPVTTMGIGGVVTVQVRQSVAENEWLLDLAHASTIVQGVIGWAPLADPAVDAVLERFASEGKFKGVRHIVQDEPDPEFLLRNDFNTGVARLDSHHLTYDILIHERQLPQAIAFVDRHSRQTFILDHAAKPRVAEHVMSPWRENIYAIAERPNVYCKLSGMVTEADWGAWRPNDLLPYVDTVLEAFGPKRLMFGSDWPVLLVAGDYAGWFNTVKTFIARLSESEQAMILGETAVTAYHL
jgi:L-fuconolactonase